MKAADAPAYPAADTPVDLAAALEVIGKITPEVPIADVEIGSMIYCVRPGDGSAREQAASCQRVLGGLANICEEYATKRYRSNVMNWGMMPFQMKGEPDFGIGDYIYVPGARAALDGDMQDIKAYVISGGADGGDMNSGRTSDGDPGVREISLYIAPMTDTEKEIVKAGCLINFNRNR